MLPQEPQYLTYLTSLDRYINRLGCECLLIIYQTGVVYAVEFSHRTGRDLINVAKKRTNIIPIIEDARHPHKYRMLAGMVDVMFTDVAQPDQARI